MQAVSLGTWWHGEGSRSATSLWWQYLVCQCGLQEIKKRHDIKLHRNQGRHQLRVDPWINLERSFGEAYGIPQAPALSTELIFLIVDLVFAYLSQRQGKGFSLCDPGAWFFTLCILITGISSWPFRTISKPHFMKRIEASPLEHLLYEKYREEQQASGGRKTAGQVQSPDGLLYLGSQIKTPHCSWSLLVKDVKMPIVSSL